LRSVSGVESVRVDAGADGALLAHLAHPHAESELETQRIAERVAADVARTCVEAGLPIIELGPRIRTLEDLFVELLEGEG
jgi:hypothetical protein